MLYCKQLMLVPRLPVTIREALFVRQKSNSFLNPILESEYSDSIYAYDAVLNQAFKNIFYKLCNINCDINERLIVVEIRLQYPTRANHIFKEVLMHIIVHLMVYLMIIYAVDGHRYCIVQCVKYCHLLFLHSTILFMR